MVDYKKLEKDIQKGFEKLIPGYLNETVVESYRDGVSFMEDQLGVSSAWDIVDEEAVKFTNNYKTPYFKDLTKTTKKYLFDNIRETVRTGGTWDDLFEKIKDNKAFTKARAEMIWRTEVARAHSHGTIDRAKSLGVTHGYVSTHPEACPICSPYDEVVMPLDDLPTIPLHPRCYISGTYVMTNEGWKKFEDLSGEELFLSLDPETRNLEYLKPNKYISYDYEGEVYHFSSIDSIGFDLVVTPDHTMFMYTCPDKENRSKKRYVFRNASEVRDHDIFYSPKNISIFLDAYCLHDLWRVNELNSEFLWKFKKEIENYNGKVWCVELPKFHTLLVRGGENGKAVWCGNCQCVVIAVPPE